jgi:hypothetical protein
MAIQSYAVLRWAVLRWAALGWAMLRWAGLCYAVLPSTAELVNRGLGGRCVTRCAIFR